MINYPLNLSINIDSEIPRKRFLQGAPKNTPRFKIKVKALEYFFGRLVGQLDINQSIYIVDL